jgi:hypothetical protein
MNVPLVSSMYAACLWFGSSAYEGALKSSRANNENLIARKYKMTISSTKTKSMAM